MNKQFLVLVIFAARIIIPIATGDPMSLKNMVIETCLLLIEIKKPHQPDSGKSKPPLNPIPPAPNFPPNHLQKNLQDNTTHSFEEGIIIETVYPDRPGRVSSRGTLWFAKSQEPRVIEIGTKVTVVQLDAVTLLVTPASPPDQSSFVHIAPLF